MSVDTTTDFNLVNILFIIFFSLVFIDTRIYNIIKVIYFIFKPIEPPFSTLQPTDLVIFLFYSFIYLFII